VAETHEPRGGASSQEAPHGWVETTITEGVVQIRVFGDIDMASAPFLGAELDGVLDVGPGSLAVDLTEVTFLDSTGLRVLLRARDRLGAFTVVVTDTGPVRRLLEQTGALELFNVVDRLDDVLGHPIPLYEVPEATEIDPPPLTEP
jgi:anti-sigma B factor antagonist